MKKRTILFVILLGVISLGILFCVLLNLNFKAALFTPVSLGAEQKAVSNHMQDKASTFLWRYGDTMYAYNQHNLKGYEGWIFTIDGTDARKVFSLKKHKLVNPIGAVDEYFYYWVSNEQEDKDTLYCFNAANETETLLYTGDLGFGSTVFFADDGSIFFPLREEMRTPTRYFLHIDGEKVLETTTESGAYLLGGKAYSVQYYYDNAEGIYCTDEEGTATEIPLNFAHRRSLIPYEGGILIHNQDSESVLYNVDAAGVLTEIFHIPCLASRSALCVVGDTAYLSFKRYKEYGSIGKRGFENDTFQGTYRINLTDFSYEKISDMIFSGIYCLDDGGLYAIGYGSNRNNDNCIYRLDYEGSVTLVFGAPGSGTNPD